MSLAVLAPPSSRDQGTADDERTARRVCVDLDGTLIAGDLLWESFIALFKRRPIAAIGTLTSLARGRAQFKKRIAYEAPIDPRVLPYREQVLKDLRELKGNRTDLVLATASDESYAHAVADHLELFTEIIASDGIVNLSGDAKAEALVRRYGQGQFDYYGNDRADLPVWRVAAGRVMVAGSPHLVRLAEREGIPCSVHSTRRGGIRPLLRALRPHQWVKNLLVFVPVIAAHQLFGFRQWVEGLTTFIAFSMCASALYLLNDVSDVSADRLHARKRHRPIAAGEVSIPVAVTAAAALLFVSSVVAIVATPRGVSLLLLAYIGATSVYSMWLKREPVVDVFILTWFYIGRIIAGGLATQTPLSSWLLGFALFLFLSLAFVKRYVEVSATTTPVPGRGYGPADALWMHAIGTVAGYMAVLILALYVTAPDVVGLYRRPRVLWLLCPLLLYWVTRLWFKAGRHLIHDDPIVESLRDGVTYVVGALAAAIAVAAAL